MSGSYGKEVSYLYRLRQWFSDHVIQEVPEDYQFCEFDCRELECSMGDWEKCERRLGSKVQAQEKS